MMAWALTYEVHPRFQAVNITSKSEKFRPSTPKTIATGTPVWKLPGSAVHPWTLKPTNPQVTVMVEQNDEKHEHIFPIERSWMDHVAILSSDAPGMKLQGLLFSGFPRLTVIPNSYSLIPLDPKP